MGILILELKQFKMSEDKDSIYLRWCIYIFKNTIKICEWMDWKINVIKVKILLLQLKNKINI